MKLKQVTRTSTFAFSPLHPSPLIATGTVSGALDDTFSDESKLEFWKPDFLSSNAPFSLGEEGSEGPIATIVEKSRFNRLSWGKEGVLAGGLESGELVLWDGRKVLEGLDNAEVLRTSQHGGTVRGLDWNGIQTNLVASGGTNGEVFIWDLKDPTKPYTPTPGSRSTKLDEITSIAWNKVVPYVLGGSSNTGNTVVWDLRGKREVVSLAYGGTSQPGFSGSRRGTSDLAWSPDNATKVVTASESDESPVVAVWDLRNARAPEKVLEGHTKGLLSLSWNIFDSSLLLTAGKDNRVLLFNPHTSQLLTSLEPSNNWAFSAQFHPLNPSLLGAAYFDGRIEIHSVQSTNPQSFLGEEDKQGVQIRDGDDVFGAIATHSENRPRMTPSLDVQGEGGKWLKRPSSVSWGFGGKIVSVGNLMGKEGGWQSGIVHLRKGVSADAVLVERAKALFPSTGDSVDEKVLEGKEGETWDALKALLHQKKKDGTVAGKEELVKLLGYDKTVVEGLVQDAVDVLKVQSVKRPGLRENVVSFSEVVDEVSAISPEEEEDDDKAPVEREHSEVGSEPSAGSITPSSVTAPTSASGAPTESSTTTANSLFSDAGDDQDADFFNTALTTQTPNGGVEEIVVPHKITSDAMSVAATAGSRASTPANTTYSVVKPFVFFPHSTEDEDPDNLLTKAILVKDWKSSARLACALGRWADGFLFGLESGDKELVEEVKKGYLENSLAVKTGSDEVGGWRGLVSEVIIGGGGGLEGVVRGINISEWPHAFVLICTYAKGEEEFGRLVEALGRRIETEGLKNPAKKIEYRKNATLTYLASRSLPSLVRLWEEELNEEEETLLSSHTPFNARSLALQTFIEKVEVFRYATSYSSQTVGEGAERLYEMYLEYAERIAGEGCLEEAKRVIGGGRIPESVKVAEIGERVKRLGGGVVAAAPAQPKAPAVPAKGVYGGYGPTSVTSAAGPYGNVSSNGPYGIPAAGPTFVDSSAPPPIQNRGPPGRGPMYAPPPPGAGPASRPTPPPPSGSYAPAPGAQANRPGPGPSSYAPPPPSGPYAHPPGQNQGPYNTPPSGQSQSPYNTPTQNQGGYAPSSYGGQTGGPGAPPPPRFGGPGGSLPPTLPLKKRPEDEGGWNDAPSVLPTRPKSNLSAGTGAVTSPFPNMPPPPSPGFSPQGGMTPPAPGRPGSRGPGQQPIPPPPKAGLRPGSVPPPPPPGRMTSPPSAGIHPPPPSGPYAPPPQSQGGYAPPPPPQNQGGYIAPSGFAGPPPGAGIAAPPPPSGAYAPPPQSTGPYAPPPQAQGPPPSAPGPYGPPPPAAGVPNAGVGQIQSPLSPPAAPAPAPAPPKRAGPPPPKYPPGDRSHIPPAHQGIHTVIISHITELKSHPQSKRLGDDLEKRINPLFDALNCETLSENTTQGLSRLVDAMQRGDKAQALAIHVELITGANAGENLGLPLSAVKQLVVRL